jgi:hypothetical protein
VTHATVLETAVFQTFDRHFEEVLRSRSRLLRVAETDPRKPSLRQGRNALYQIRLTNKEKKP